MDLEERALNWDPQRWSAQQAISLLGSLKWFRTADQCPLMSTAWQSGPSTTGPQGVCWISSEASLATPTSS